MRISAIVLFAFACAARAQSPFPPGRTTFESRCSVCHGADGNGGEMGPGIARRVPNLTDAQIKSTVLEGLPSRGMPANNIGEGEMPPLVAFLRDGAVISEGFDEAALRTADRRIHLLRKVDGGRFREVTSQSDWPTYNGDIGGNRYTTLKQIDKSNVSQVSLRWMFTLPNVSTLQMRPLVVDGVMYATSGNECYALDAGTGRQIWHYQRPRPPGLTGGGAGGVNRGRRLCQRQGLF